MLVEWVMGVGVSKNVLHKWEGQEILNVENVSLSSGDTLLHVSLMIIFS